MLIYAFCKEYFTMSEDLQLITKHKKGTNQKLIHEISNKLTDT